MNPNEQNEAELPVYALRILPYANRNLDTALDFVRETCGDEGDSADEYARLWRRGLLNRTATLATLPYRFAIAPEAASFAPPPVRAMPYQQNPGSPTGRVLFRIFEPNENDAAHVVIIAFRHGAQKPPTREEGRAIDAANA